MKKVLIPTKLDPAAKQLLEAHGGYSVLQDENTNLQDLAPAHPDTYALIVRSEKVTSEIIDSIPGLKVIIRAGAGYNNIDTGYARKKGIDVMNTPGANANAVAEEVIAMILADARHIVQADASTRQGLWEKKKFMGRELSKKTVGIIGLGAIGRTLAHRLEGFDVNILGFDPVISSERARDLGIQLADLDTIFSSADYISLHIPENDETRRMINRSLLEKMKPGSTLVNCARAGVLDEDDFRALKQEKQIRLLNDVYPADAEGDKPIKDIADLMLPHLGASTKEANYNAAYRSAEQLIEFDEKGITSYIVNRDIPAGLDEAFADLAYTITLICRSLTGKDKKLKMVESSFYGTLKPYADWLVVPIVCALNKNFDRSLDYRAAEQFLEEMGVEYNNRRTDDQKGFENSITIDLHVGTGGENFRSISVRGTVAEGNIMISRIGDFDKLYFDPTGGNVAFSYEDRPGVLAQITSRLAKAGVNIEDVRNPQDSKRKQALALLKVDQPVSNELIDSIKEEISADFAVYFTI